MSFIGVLVAVINAQPMSVQYVEEFSGPKPMPPMSVGGMQASASVMGPEPMDGPMMGGPGPSPAGGAVVINIVQAPEDVSDTDVSVVQKGGAQMNVISMPRPIDPMQQKTELTGDMADSGGDEPEMSSPDVLKPTQAKSEVKQSPADAKSPVMKTQDESVAVKPVENAKGLLDAKKADGADPVQTEVTSNSEKKQTGTKKTGMKQPGGQKTAGSQKKGVVKANKGKKNGAAKKGHKSSAKNGQTNGGKNGKNAAKKGHITVKKVAANNNG